MFGRRKRGRIRMQEPVAGVVIPLASRSHRQSAAIRGKGHWPWEEEPAAEPRRDRRRGYRRRRHQPWP